MIILFNIPSEFINLISSESNEVCSREEKRTIAPEHVLKALEVSNKSFSACSVSCCLCVLLPYPIVNGQQPGMFHVLLLIVRPYDEHMNTSS